MSAVNWGEVFYTEWRYRGEVKARQAEAHLLEMPIAVIAADRERASRQGIKQRYGLGYADAFAANWPSNAALGWSRPILSFRKLGRR